MTGDKERIFIDGGWHDPEGGYYSVVNPATEQVVAEAPEATPAQARAAAGAARDALKGWAATAPAERAEILNRIGDLLVKHGESLVPLVQAETGATMRVASTMQVPVAVDRFRYYGRRALESFALPLAPQAMPQTALAPAGLIGGVALRQPVGVVACITPYNFPLVNMAGKVAPALAMGNTVVVKPAPQDPLQVLRFAEIARGGRAAGRGVQRGDRVGRGDRRGAGRVAGRGHGVVHRLDVGGAGDRRGRRRRNQAPAAGARRQGRGDRLRGC